MLIGLTGYAGAGKDEVADTLVREFGFKKIGFADPMYRIALDLNPWIRQDGRLLRDIVERIGWTAAKRMPEVREFLQRLGESGRQNLGEQVWINAAARTLLVTNARHKNVVITNARHKNVVITNARHKNEAEWVKRRGGTIVLVSRVGFGPVNDHVSDQGLAFKYATHSIDNIAGIAELQAVTRYLFTTVLDGR